MVPTIQPRTLIRGNDKLGDLRSKAPDGLLFSRELSSAVTVLYRRPPEHCNAASIQPRIFVRVNCVPTAWVNHTDIPSIQPRTYIRGNADDFNRDIVAKYLLFSRERSSAVTKLGCKTIAGLAALLFSRERSSAVTSISPHESTPAFSL